MAARGSGCGEYGVTIESMMQSLSERSADSEHGAGGLSQFISFAIGDDQYGVDIMAVREIKGWSGITHLPNSPTMCAACSICAA